MKFKKALKILKQGKPIKTPSNVVVKLDKERNYLITLDGYYSTAYVNVEDIFSDDWQFSNEYELQYSKDDYGKKYSGPKTELTGVEFTRDIRNKQYIVIFNAGRYHEVYALHTYYLTFSELSKLNSTDELAELFAKVISDYGDCTISTALLKSSSERFWRGNL